MPDFILSPLFWSLLLALLLGILWRRVARWLRYVLLAVELLLVIAMTPVGANRLVHLVESRVPPSATCALPAPGVIVLLSGGLATPASAVDDYAALTHASVQRLFAAVALWRAHPGSGFVISGGGHKGHIAESEVLASLAHRMGVTADSLRLESRSQTTWENASDLAREQPPLPRRIWLVSSGLHLPRALVAFHAFGFAPCPYSSGSLYVPFSLSLGYFMPQTSSLAKADLAIHELLGGWVYAWRARHSQAVMHAEPQSR